MALNIIKHFLSMSFLKVDYVMFYKILQVDFLPPGFFLSTALIASSKTKVRFDLFLAEHSTMEYAWILVLSFFPSANVTYFSEPCTLKSDFVPKQKNYQQKQNIF